MKTNQELDTIATNLHHNAINGALLRDYIPHAVKDLRSIELDAWREARELVGKRPMDYAGGTGLMDTLAEMDRIIQQLQLK